MLTKKILVTVFVVMACYAAVQGVRLVTGPKGKFFFDKRVSSRAKGNPGAPLWIVEYLDFQCPPCRQAGPVLRSYLNKYPSQIYLQARFRPLLVSHVYALKSALYAECAADQGKFWVYHDLLFDRQEDWKSASDPDSLFFGYAKEAGMDLRKLDKCVHDPAVKERVIAEKDEAVGLGIQTTPTFFVNSKKVVGVQALKEELETFFSKKKEKMS